MPRTSTALAALRAAALDYPETREDHPWGHVAIKVRGKAFVFLAEEDGTLSCSVKPPQSHGAALRLPFARPTGCGLGRAGWVGAAFAKGEAVPVPLLLEWLEESYRAIAPKTQLKRLDAGEREPASPRRAARRR